MREFTYDRNGFYKDGEPFQILSGTIHYFRVVPQYWQDRLKKLKECGLNTVETYTCWNLHERKEGQFDFSGMLDLAAFLKTAQELGLYVILRPGPYICGEWDMGGLPSWLLAVDGMRIRCNHPGFLEKVRNYYTKLFEIVRPFLYSNGGNILMLQVENEYGSYGDDRAYMEAIRNIYRENDMNCLYFTSDGPGYFMLNGGTLPDTLATVNFGSNPKGNFETFRKIRPEDPLTCMEYWNGWFDHWYEEHHTRGSGDTAQVYKEMLDMNANVNFYMFHGGTNFGFLNGANYDNGLQPTVTSYDYNCPISECGDLTPKYMEIRKVMEERFGTLPPLTVKNLPKKAYGEVQLTKQAYLFEHLSEVANEPVECSYPLSMEELGQDFGFVLYQSTMQGPFETLELSIDGLNDRAHIYAGERLLGIKENTGKRDDKVNFGLDFGEKEQLNILVENLGRVNYGGHIWQRKGITQGVRIANMYHFGWKMYSISCDDISKISYQPWKADARESYQPQFLSGILHVDEVCDTFVRMDGFKKGCVFINGVNIGRYWNEAGPQKTLYVPAPLLHQGENEVTIFELDGYEAPYIQFTDQEDLG